MTFLTFLSFCVKIRKCKIIRVERLSVANRWHCHPEGSTIAFHRVHKHGYHSHKAYSNVNIIFLLDYPYYSVCEVECRCFLTIIDSFLLILTYNQKIRTNFHYYTNYPLTIHSAKQLSQFRFAILITLLLLYHKLRLHFFSTPLFLTFFCLYFKSLQYILDNTRVLNQIDSKTFFPCILNRCSYMVGKRIINNQKSIMEHPCIFYFG